MHNSSTSGNAINQKAFSIRYVQEEHEKTHKQSYTHIKHVHHGGSFGTLFVVLAEVVGWLVVGRDDNSSPTAC